MKNNDNIKRGRIHMRASQALIDEVENLARAQYVSVAEFTRRLLVDAVNRAKGQ